MPYIKKEQRNELDPIIEILRSKLSSETDVAVGQLNYITTKLGWHVMRRGVRYHKINAVIGALECSKLELYRRIAGPYEDQKIAENGDVFDMEI